MISTENEIDASPIARELWGLLLACYVCTLGMAMVLFPVVLLFLGALYYPLGNIEFGTHTFSLDITDLVVNGLFVGQDYSSIRFEVDNSYGAKIDKELLKNKTAQTNKKH